MQWLLILLLFINKLFETVDFQTNVSDKIFIEEQRFEAIIASLSSSNEYFLQFGLIKWRRSQIIACYDGFETVFFNKKFIAYVSYFLI